MPALSIRQMNRAMDANRLRVRAEFVREIFLRRLDELRDIDPEWEPWFDACKDIPEVIDWMNIPAMDRAVKALEWRIEQKRRELELTPKYFCPNCDNALIEEFESAPIPEFTGDGDWILLCTNCGFTVGPPRVEDEPF